MKTKNKRARARKNSAAATATREFPMRSADCHKYARVTRMLGDGRLAAACDDGIERLCRIRGKMRGREFVNVGDVVLVSVRDFEPDKADVVWKYSAAEATMLQSYGELEGFESPKQADDDECGGEIVFENL